MYEDPEESYEPQGDSSEPGSHAESDVEKQYYRHPTVEIPEVIKQFLQYFQIAVSESRMFELQDLYENTFPKLSEEFYERSNWPDSYSVAPVVNNDPVFLVLYKELYFRHIYARHPGPTLEQRTNSYFNYCDFFNPILTSDAPFKLELPDVWLWELVDEFIYQFQCFAQFRAKPLKSVDVYQQMPQNHQIWNVLCVLNVLHSLIEKSNIRKQLEVQASGGDPESVAGEFGRHSLYRMLGYFSLVGLLRLHTLLGDYYQAIRTLEFIDIHKKTQYSSVPACQITMSYYVGFCYMMMRRYSDAIRTFSSILLYLQRAKQLFQARTYQNDQINKQTEQMYHLLAICLVLHPQCIDESLQQALREKNYHEKMIRMQYRDEKEFELCFLFACPKFVSPTAPSEDQLTEDHSRDPTEHQLHIFMDEVKQQNMIPTIRSYLKLYKTLPLPKLATFMDQVLSPFIDPGRQNFNMEEEIKILISLLLCFKHKMKNVVWNKGISSLDGTFQSTSDLDFYIDNDMIHIADTKVATRHADVFVRRIHKFDELRKKLQSLKMQ